MKDEKTKVKEEQLIEMVSSFCDENLDDEFKELCVKLVQKMGRKHDVPFKRGKLEIWASSVVYAIAQINFLFDKSSDLYCAPDKICDFFNTKKSTVSNKARTIRDMFNMGHFDEEFSAKYILNNAPKVYLDEKSGFLIPEEFIRNPMDDFFDKSYELFSEGKVDEALEMLETIPKDDSEYPRAMFYKSLMREFGNEEDLVDFLDENFSLDDDEDESLYLQALDFAEFGEFGEALDIIEKAIEINPNNDSYWNDRGNFLAKLEIYDEAYESFDKAIKLNPNDSIIWSNKAFTYLEDEKYDEALKCYDAACKLSPHDIHPIMGKVNVYMAKEDLKNAKKYLDKAKKIDENDLEYLSEKGNYHVLNNEPEIAIEYFDKCLSIDEEFSKVLLFKALALMQLDDEEGADKCLRKVGEINPLLLMSISEDLDDL